MRQMEREMKNSRGFLLLCLLGVLFGCSSKPDVGDVEDLITDTWAFCNELKVVNLEKTNGVDRGDSYDMGISYGLEVLRDVPLREFDKHDGTACSAGVEGELLRMFFVQFALNDGKIALNETDGTLRKGDIVNVNTTFNMVNSENGWIKQ